MTKSLAYPRTSWFLKLCECILTVIAIANVLMTPLELLPRSFWEIYGNYVEYALLGVVLLAVAGSVVYTGRWHRREQRGEVNSGLRHAWLQGLIRYWLAFSLSTYGFAKILGTQFQTPSYRLDIPLGEVTGFALTWYYYGYSYTLAVIIALFQIGGSVLLLYRRTTLLGVMILLPVLVNIVLINVFFNIATGALFNSIVFTLALLFLLSLDWDKLRRAYWDVVERLPPITAGRPWAKHGLRLLPIAAAFALVAYLARTNSGDTVLAGTWKVERMIRNGRVLPANTWLTDSAAWQRVYFAGWQGCAFSPNPYRYHPKESWRGTYVFDSLNNNLRLLMYQSDAARVPDTLQATLSQRTHKAMRLRAVVGNDTLDLQLARLR